MEPTSSLLIALMFVTVVTMSIGAILTTAASALQARASLRTGALYLNWLVLLLLYHFNLFWHTLDIVQISDPTFRIFLLVIAGPIVLFFTAHIFTAGAIEQARALDDFFDSVRREFYWLLAGLQGWLVVVDMILGDGYTTASMLTTGFLALLLLLSVLPRSAQPAGALATWLLIIAMGWFVG